MWSKASSRDSKETNRSSESTAGSSGILFSSKVSASQDDPQVKIGKTIVIRGELSGDEDLTIEGRVEGRISFENHHLTIGETGNISAEVVAKSVTVLGKMEGNLHAKEKAEIAESGSLIGDIHSPRIVIAEGAKFKGAVEMTGGESSSNAISSTYALKDSEDSQSSELEEVAARSQ
jgi:cytoskeletal protein CcmA (bactofilin family)